MKKKISFVLYGLIIILLLLVGWLSGFKMAKSFLGNTFKNRISVVDEESVATKVVEKSSLSVVTVSANKDVLDTLSLDTKNVEKDIGTGFIVSSDGLIVTNKHVVADTSAKYKVIIGKDETVEVKNIYRDPINDLAILKVDKTGLTPVEMGDSGELKVGQTVIAIGTALGEFRSTVTKGVISGLSRGITASGDGVTTEKLDDVIQTDAAINPGNSGGPLFNSVGQVIGVNVATSQNGQSIGFALPINLVKSSIDNFRKTGEFDRPYLGVAYKMISKKVASENNLPVGAFVQTIVKDSPADKAGLKTGDIITEVDSKKITDTSKDTFVVEIINQKKIGDTLKIKYFRDKTDTEVEVKLEKKG